MEPQERAQRGGRTSENSELAGLLAVAVEASGPSGGGPSAASAALNRLAVALTKSVRQKYCDLWIGTTGPLGRPADLQSDEDTEATWAALFEGGLRGLRFHPGVGRGELETLIELLRPQGGPSADETLELLVRERDRLTELYAAELKHVEALLWRGQVHQSTEATAPMLSPQEQVERWHRLLAEPEGSEGSPGTIALKPQDFRAGVLKGQDFDWIRLAREPAPEEAERRHRPRIASAIDKELIDFSGYLTQVATAGGRALEGVRHAMAGMVLEADTTRQAALLKALVEHPRLGSRLVPELLETWEHRDEIIASIERTPEAFQEVLEALVSNLPACVAPVVSRLSDGEARRSLEGMLQAAIAQPIAEYGLQLESSDGKRALEAVEKLLSLSSPDAFAKAITGFTSPHPNVRRRVVQALLDQKEPDLSLVLPAALMDEDRGVRINGLRLVGKTGENTHLRRVLQQVKEKDFGKLDIEERLACIRAIGPHSRLPQIHSYLSNAAQGLKLFGGKEAAQVQAEVVRWLVRSTNPQARVVTEKLLGKWSTSPEIKEVIRQERARAKTSGTEGKTRSEDGS